MKTKIRDLLIFNLIAVTFLYCYMFILYPENFSFFVCNEFVSNYSEYFKISFFIPISCDLELYLVGVRDISSIVEFDYNYQTRPLYLLYLKIFYSLFKNFIVNVTLLNFITFLIAHLVIVNITFFIFINSFNRNKLFLSNWRKYFALFILLLNPIFKFGIFDSSHQTLTLLQFVLSFYLLQKNITLNKKGYFIAFILGLLSLANMTFMICTLFLLFSNFKNKDININLIMRSIFVVIIVILPKIFWNYYILYQGFEPYNAATEYWRQFIWLKDFILVSYENINYNVEGGEYYCMSVPLFMKCYLIDFLNTLIYLGGPVILIIINLIFEKDSKSKEYSKDLKNIIFVSLTMFSFWAFMGWYPPLRLNLYSLGFLVTLILATQLLNNSPTTRENLYFSIHFLYFLSLNHWNNLDIVSFNFGILTSYVLIVVYLLSLRNNYLTSSKP